jgi:hypothetical protein
MESIIRIRTRVPAGTVILLELCAPKRARDFDGVRNAVTRITASELGRATIIAISKVAAQTNVFRIEIPPFLKLTSQRNVGY